MPIFSTITHIDACYADTFLYIRKYGTQLLESRAAAESGSEALREALPVFLEYAERLKRPFLIKEGEVYRFAFHDIERVKEFCEWCRDHAIWYTTWKRATVDGTCTIAQAAHMKLRWS